jgi:hypothetical protein
VLRSKLWAARIPDQFDVQNRKGWWWLGARGSCRVCRCRCENGEDQAGEIQLEW